MDCPNCHQPLREGAIFCTRCGARTSAGGAVSGAESVPTAEPGREGVGVTITDEGSESLVGRVLDGKYEIVAPLGEGGMGSVYRARRVLIGDEVAVKVLHRKFVNDETLVERFRREARAAAQLHHPNVVTIHDYGEARGARGFAYIVMELVRGDSLRALLRREGRLGAARAVSLMRDVCAGVGAAHRREIIHRDIKPDNIIVVPADEDVRHERVKVVDFGIAKLRDMAADASLTEAGAVVGTPFYMSPEQCRGEPLDARADVYSLGALLYEMLAGRPPFTAPTITGVILKHINEPPPPMPEDARVPPELQAAVMRALSKEASGRQRDAGDFSREIQAAVSTEGRGAATADAIFPANARPAPVTPSPLSDTGGSHPAPQTPTTPAQPPQTTGAGQRAQQTHSAPNAQQQHSQHQQSQQQQARQQQAHSQQQQPHTHAGATQYPPQAPPRRKSRAPLVIGLLVVMLLGFGGVVLVGLYLLGRNSGRRPVVIVNRNARTAPTPAAPSPTPTDPATAAMQRAEQKIVAGTSLSTVDLAGLAPAQLRVLRNAVYARHGRTFTQSDLQQYFQSRPWYRARSDFNERALTPADRANADLLKFLEEGGTPASFDAATVSREVGDVLSAWAASTTGRNLEEHMKFYAGTLETYYRRANVPASQVRADRARAFAQYDSMDVTLEDVRVEPDPTGARATVTFKKSWEFDSDERRSNGSVLQQLTLSKASGRWLITGEKDLQVYFTDGEEY